MGHQTGAVAKQDYDRASATPTSCSRSSVVLEGAQQLLVYARRSRARPTAADDAQRPAVPAPAGELDVPTGLSDLTVEGHATTALSGHPDSRT